jgi:AcrR family transcriptional regulator
MPPKAKISKEMILDTVLDITRQAGFDAVNARSIADKLQCSTRPIFTCYKNMDELKCEFLDFAFVTPITYFAKLFFL